MFSASLVALALVGSTFATVFVTSPVASTTCSPKSQCTISWQDDGKAPTLQQFGPARVSVYAGNAQQQTLLQAITPSVDVSTTSSILFTVDPTIGPNSDEYFIRFESISFKDPASPQYPALAFSAKFTLSDMTGTFSPAVQAQINGQSTAPLSPPATSAGGSSSVARASTTASTAKASGTASSSGSAKPTSSSGAEKLTVASVTGLVGLAVVVFGLGL